MLLQGLQVYLVRLLALLLCSSCFNAKLFLGVAFSRVAIAPRKFSKWILISARQREMSRSSLPRSHTVCVYGVTLA